MEHPTELNIAGYPVNVVIHYCITERTTGYDDTFDDFEVKKIEIPTREEFLKKTDNTIEEYNEIYAEVNNSYNVALEILRKECSLDGIENVNLFGFKL